MVALEPGVTPGVALAVVAFAIMLWPFAHRMLTARRQRVAETRIASGLGPQRRSP